jgi:hypothetical protein
MSARDLSHCVAWTRLVLQARSAWKQALPFVALWMLCQGFKKRSNARSSRSLRLARMRM